MSGISALTPVQGAAARSTPGFAFALPGSEDPEGESFLVTVDYSQRARPHADADCSSVAAGLASGQPCLKDLQQLPFSAGAGGSYRAVKFTTVDARYDVQVGVFEKLEETTANRPLELDRVAAIIAEKYCSLYRTAGEKGGFDQ